MVIADVMVRAAVRATPRKDFLYYGGLKDGANDGWLVLVAALTDRVRALERAIPSRCTIRMR